MLGPLSRTTRRPRLRRASCRCPIPPGWVGRPPVSLSSLQRVGAPRPLPPRLVDDVRPVNSGSLTSSGASSVPGRASDRTGSSPSPGSRPRPSREPRGRSPSTRAAGVVAPAREAGRDARRNAEVAEHERHRAREVLAVAPPRVRHELDEQRADSPQAPAVLVVHEPAERRLAEPAPRAPRPPRRDWSTSPATSLATS